MNLFYCGLNIIWSCNMYMYQLPEMIVTITYYKHILIKRNKISLNTQFKQSKYTINVWWADGNLISFTIKSCGFHLREWGSSTAFINKEKKSITIGWYCFLILIHKQFNLTHCFLLIFIHGSYIIGLKLDFSHFFFWSFFRAPNFLDWN